MFLYFIETATESHFEKDLERALEQTSRFYSDLEHIATDLNILSKRYSQSQTFISPLISRHNRSILNTIDVLDWDWNDIYSSSFTQSPKIRHRKHQHDSSSSLSRLNNHNRNKSRKKLINIHKQTDYNESDFEICTSHSYDCTNSPLKRRKILNLLSAILLFFFFFEGSSSVYFDSTDNASDDENFGEEFLQNPSLSVL